MKQSELGWLEAYSHFPNLEFIKNPSWICVPDRYQTTPEVNFVIQQLARACPKLKLVWLGYPENHAVILRGEGPGTQAKIGEAEGGAVKWTIRMARQGLVGDDNLTYPFVKEGEVVYGG